MRIYHSLAEAPSDFGPSALTIGNFDGVHAGHRHIFRRVRETAEERGLKASVLTFDPHPTRVVAPARAPRLMTTPEQRCALMAEEGIEQALILPFNHDVAQLEAAQFVKEILVDKLGARAVLVGDNFHFGHRAGGNAALLRKLGRVHGFTTEIVPAVSVRGRMVSSSSIRQLLEAGKVARAARLLGRPHALEGIVVPGHGIGSRQTVPTLNLAPGTELLPCEGVYITRTRDLDDGRMWPSITNIGRRPTFNGGDLTVETFLIEPLEGAPPRHIHVELLRRVREERKFAGAEDLKRQILRDVERARAYFRRCARWVRRPAA
ncbi:MAG: bifunctional riboflavin kinase/FAD synthetase [Acidobacteria bacterium]|nr:bifunctional riboflavin kinase/FAD synthetase [Acidobacteriota bacterium]